MPVAVPYTDVDNLLNSTAFGKELCKSSMPVVHASKGSVGTAVSAALNRSRLATMITDLISGGVPKILVLDTPGTLEIDMASSNGHYSDAGTNSRGMIDVTPSGTPVPAGTVLYVPRGVTVKLPNSSMTGSTNFADFVIGDAAGLDFTLIVEGVIDLNSVNQGSWTHGYRQLNGSSACRITCNNGAFTRVHVLGRGLGTVKNTFANSIAISGDAGDGVSAVVKGGTARIEGLRCERYGEGPTIDVCERGRMYDIENIFYPGDWGADAGDHFEFANDDYVEFGRLSWRSNDGTRTNRGGALDVGGSTIVRGSHVYGRNSANGFEASSTNSGTLGARKCENLFVSSLTLRDIEFTAIKGNEGVGVWHGVDVEATGSNGQGIYLFRTGSNTGQRHVFYSPRCVAQATLTVEGLLEVNIENPNFTSVASAIAPQQNATYTGTPTINIRGGGTIHSSGAYAVLSNGGGLGAYHPTITVSERTTMTGGAGVLFYTAGGTLKNVVVDGAFFDSTATGLSNVLCSVGNIDAAPGATPVATTILNTPTGMRPFPKHATIFVESASGVSGSLTFSIGTAAGSNIDIVASTTITITAVGQRFTFPIVTTGGLSSGAGVSFVITAAMSGTCRIRVELDGRLVGDV